MHYADNWYLDAWCHKRKALRAFMLARIHRAELDQQKAITVPAEQQADHFADSYGIFAGKAKHLAKLKFTGPAAREAESLQWHPAQKGEWQGRHYLLEIPYNDDRELVRTLLGYGADVEILAPTALKKRVLTKAKQIVGNYESDWRVGRF